MLRLLLHFTMTPRDCQPNIVVGFCEDVLIKQTPAQKGVVERGNQLLMQLWAVISLFLFKVLLLYKANIVEPRPFMTRDQLFLHCILQSLHICVFLEVFWWSKSAPYSAHHQHYKRRALLFRQDFNQVDTAI